ncbi:MAG: flagellar type III secretion system pore protein FliP [Nocardioides sp.]
MTESHVRRVLSALAVLICLVAAQLLLGAPAQAVDLPSPTTLGNAGPIPPQDAVVPVVDRIDPVAEIVPLTDETAPGTPTTPEGPAPSTEEGLQGPVGPSGPGSSGNPGDITIQLEDITSEPSTPIVALLGLTLLSLAPAILLTCTSFTKILVVLGLTRNALGLQQIPPNQVLAGLALFLSIFIMGPVLSEMNEVGLQPYLDGTKTQTQAFDDGIDPLRGFMIKQAGDKEIALLTEVAGRDKPEGPEDVALTTLIPAFVLSELKQAFIIGFMIFIPFLVIDIVVSAGLMSLGMMMMPPVMVSLPFKLLLFVLVDGWGMIVRSLVQSYGGG